MAKFLSLIITISSNISILIVVATLINILALCRSFRSFPLVASKIGESESSPEGTPPDSRCF
eukprot:TCALIF_10589-PA protein Name:"Protein of unknown function" AED:0.75 eAED:0.75 QI:117/0/0.5/0.5/1/1/2/0/61